MIRGGLEEGELVCLSPVEVAVDGMAVRVQRPGVEAPAAGARDGSAEDGE